MIGNTYFYSGLRTGECVDVSECGKWLLLKRDEVKTKEKDKVAVLLIDPEVFQVAA